MEGRTHTDTIWEHTDMFVKRALAASALATGLVVTMFTTPAFADGYFQTETNLNLRECQTIGSGCPVETVIPKGTTIYVDCWAYGTAVNGNTIWYYVWWNGYDGMAAGDYINTGHDPNPSVSQCV
jgi:hypothetical protein